MNQPQELSVIPDGYNLYICLPGGSATYLVKMGDRELTLDDRSGKHTVTLAADGTVKDVMVAVESDGAVVIHGGLIKELRVKEQTLYYAVWTGSTHNVTYGIHLATERARNAALGTGGSFIVLL